MIRRGRLRVTFVFADDRDRASAQIVICPRLEWLADPVSGELTFACPEMRARESPAGRRGAALLCGCHEFLAKNCLRGAPKLGLTGSPTRPINIAGGVTGVVRSQLHINARKLGWLTSTT